MKEEKASRKYKKAYVSLKSIALLCVGLDYNIFIITRMYELRLSGHSTPDAIALGLARTGGIITSAGKVHLLFLPKRKR